MFNCNVATQYGVQGTFAAIISIPTIDRTAGNLIFWVEVWVNQAAFTAGNMSLKSYPVTITMASALQAILSNPSNPEAAIDALIIAATADFTGATEVVITANNVNGD